MPDWGVTIRGLQEAQQANLRVVRAVRPSGAFGRAVVYGLTAAQRYAVSITHVDTGTLRAAHRIDVQGGGLRGRVYIDPSATNPRSGQLAALYGPAEHARGGDHAFYQRTVTEAGPGIVQDMARRLVKELP